MGHQACDRVVEHHTVPQAGRGHHHLQPDSSPNLVPGMREVGHSHEEGRGEVAVLDGALPLAGRMRDSRGEQVGPEVGVLHDLEVGLLDLEEVLLVAGPGRGQGVVPAWEEADYEGDSQGLVVYSTLGQDVAVDL